MTQRVLVYGATGYSGRLIAREATRKWGNLSNTARAVQVVLAARNASELWRLCGEVGLEGMELALDSRGSVVRALTGFTVVINAAGPFALTAARLAKAAMEARCHYVDINGETDVYKNLDDLGYIADQRKLTLVCAAGAVATASDFLVHHALKSLESSGARPRELAAIRIAVPRLDVYSRGSAQTSLRWTREEVLVARSNLDLETVAPAPDSNVTLPRGAYARVQHIPIGQLERSFDFGGKLGRCIGAAVAMVDVLTAMRTARRHEVAVGTIEVYMAMKSVQRWGYNWSALGSTWMNLPPALRLTEWVANQLPEGPSASERRANRHTVLLEIESIFGEIVIDWRLDTPNCYTLTASCAIGIADKLLRPLNLKGIPLHGWRTPAELLEDLPLPTGASEAKYYPFADCSLSRRKG